MNCTTLPTEYVFNFGVMKVCQCHSSKRFDGPSFFVGVKKLGCHLPSKLLIFDFLFYHKSIWEQVILSQPPNPPPSPPSNGYKQKVVPHKCNLMLPCDKSLCNVLDYWIAFVVHKNAQANFACACLNVMKHWQDSKFGLPPCKNSRLLGDGFSYHVPHISLNVPPFHHNWYAYVVFTWMA